MYDSIDDLPIFNWWEIQKSGDLSYLYHGNKGNPEGLADLWEELYNDWYKRFGLTDRLKSVINKRCRIAQMKIQQFVEGKAHLQTHIEIAEKELENLQTGAPEDHTRVIVALERYLGFSLDTRTLPTSKYYTYLHEFNA